MKKKTLRFLIPVTVLIIVAYYIIINQQMHKEKLLSLNQRYVIGEVTKKRTPTRGGPIIVFSYSIDGKLYSREDNGTFSIKEGSRYFVSIPEGHEDEGIILFDKQVPDSIKATPKGGWLNFPLIK